MNEIGGLLTGLLVVLAFVGYGRHNYRKGVREASKLNKVVIDCQKDVINEMIKQNKN